MTIFEELEAEAPALLQQARMAISEGMLDLSYVIEEQEMTSMRLSTYLDDKQLRER